VRKRPLSKSEREKLRKKLEWDTVVTNVPIHPELDIDDPRQEFEDRFYKGDRLVLVVRHGRKKT